MPAAGHDDQQEGWNAEHIEANRNPQAKFGREFRRLPGRFVVERGDLFGLLV